MVKAVAVVVFLCAGLWGAAGFAQVDSSAPSDGIADEAVASEAEGAPEAQADGYGALDPEEADFMGRLNEEIDRRTAEVDSREGEAFAGARVPDGGRILLQGFFALCVVIALILLVYYVARRWGKKVPLLAGATLGTVLGRVHLERGSTLHFVRTGGRVLVVGVSGNAVSLVSEFDAAAFERLEAVREEEPEPAPPFNPDSFLAQLQASSQAMGPALEMEEAQVDDDEIAALRGDIQRLQRYLREEARESQD